MSETIIDKRWHPDDVVKDFKEQGGIKIVIKSSSPNDNAYGGETSDGIPFSFIWVHNEYLLLTMNMYSAELVKAFEKVLEYKPFAQYKINAKGHIIVEWDKNDPQGRLQDLQRQSNYVIQKLEY